MKAATASPIATVLAIAALATPAAQAHNRNPVAQRGSATRRLRGELVETRDAVAHAASEIAGIRSELGSSRVQVQTLRAQASRLHATLQRTERQLETVQAQAAALHVDADAISMPVGVAVQQVREEVAYARGGLSSPRSQLISEAAMDYVAGHVSTTLYGYLKTSGRALPRVNAKDTLRTQAGICGQAAAAFAAIVERFGLHARSVNFYFDDPGPKPAPDDHVAVEVLYDGSWHFFDPTYGLFWIGASGNVLSINAIRSGLGSLQKDVASFTNVFEDAVLGNDTWFETDPATRVVIGTPPLTG